MTVDRDSELLHKIGELAVEPAFEDIDPDKTLVREDWESIVIRRIAPHVAAVQSALSEDSRGSQRFGWESEGLRRLAQELQRSGR